MSVHDVSEEHTFWLKKGTPIRSLAELGRELQRMSKDEFDHHVSKKHNDFANWVEHCIHDKALAKQLRKAKTRQKTANLVEQRIKELTIFQKPRAKANTSAPTRAKPSKTRTVPAKKPRKPKPKAKSARKRAKRPAKKTASKTTRAAPKPSAHRTTLTLAHPQKRDAATIGSYILFGAVAGAALTFLILSL